MSRVMRPAAVVEYPYSDGRPMAESEAQLRAMVYLLGVLYAHYRDHPDVYVGGDMFVYYEEGNPAAAVAPDVFVVVGAPKRSQAPRLSYKLWEEPKGPDFVLEVVSRRTWAADRDKKRALYARLGVGEYWLYDPTGERIRSRLRAMRLGSGGYREVVPEAVALEGRCLRSAVLGLDVRVARGGALRVRDPVTGRDLEDYDEVHDSRDAEVASRRAAEARLGEEAAARRMAEARAAEEATARSMAEARVGEEAVAHRTTKARLEEEVAAREARIAELEARLRSGS